MNTEPVVEFSQEQIDSLYELQKRLMEAEIQIRIQNFKDNEIRMRGQELWIKHVKGVSWNNIIQSSFFVFLLILLYFK